MEEKSLSTRCWEYLMTTSAILKIAGMLFSGLAFGFSLAAKWNRYGGTWVEFSSLDSCVMACVWLFINMCRKEPNRLAEIICYTIMCTMIIISAVIAGLKSKTYGAKLILCTTFCVTAFLIFAADLAIMYRQFNWSILLPKSAAVPDAATTTAAATTPTKIPKSKSNTNVAPNKGQ